MTNQTQAILPNSNPALRVLWVTGAERIDMDWVPWTGTWPIVGWLPQPGQHGTGVHTATPIAVSEPDDAWCILDTSTGECCAPGRWGPEDEEVAVLLLLRERGYRVRDKEIGEARDRKRGPRRTVTPLADKGTVVPLPRKGRETPAPDSPK